MTSRFEHYGCTFAYDIRGDGPPVIFIQGIGVHGSASVPQVEGLHDRYRCLWFDNRGIGKSQPVAHLLTVEMMAKDALALMDSQGWQSAHVVGHSLGGLVAQQVALMARERVRSLSLLCTFANGKYAGRSTLWMIWAGMRIKFGSRRMRRKAFLQMVLPPQALVGADTEELAAKLAPIFGHDLAEEPPIVAAQFVALEACDTLARLHELAGIPTLVISAAYDRISVPQTSRGLAAGIPGAKLIEIADASHGLPITNAQEVNRLLGAHFSAAENAIV